MYHQCHHSQELIHMKVVNGDFSLNLVVIIMILLLLPPIETTVKDDDRQEAMIKSKQNAHRQYVALVVYTLRLYNSDHG